MARFAFSDLHGQYDLWKQIKEYLKPNDVAYCLGDCVDRGDAGLKILNEVISHPNIILLRGNHEDFINSIGSYDYNLYEKEGYMTSKMYLWYSNEAEKTIEDFGILTEEKRAWLIHQIRNLPTHAEYINSNGDIIYLCHAGRNPDTEEIQDTKEGMIPTNNYIWDRNHIYDSKWFGKDNEYCVHGHTPVKYLYYYLNQKEEFPNNRFEIFKYCEGHKIDIDLSSFDTHRACLLNLDTFEPIYFKDRTISEEEQNNVNNRVV